MKDADLKDIWNHYQPSDPFDKEKANLMYSEGLSKYSVEIDKIKYNLKNKKLTNIFSNLKGYGFK